MAKSVTKEATRQAKEKPSAEKQTRPNKEQTIDRIIDAAIALFNAQGSGAVSTNHIAEAAGVSPGNLYYHFHNKEEIIRAVFERLFAEWDQAFALQPDPTIGIDTVQTLVRANFEIMSAYQFVYRELLALLGRDPVLHARYQEVRARGYNGFREVVAVLSRSGVFIPIDDATTDRLADICWLISEFWLSTIAITHQQINADHKQRGIDLMLHTLQPYLAD